MPALVGLAGNLPRSAFGASQEGGDATVKGGILSPHIFPFADLLPYIKILGWMGVNVLSPHTWTSVSKKGGAKGYRDLSSRHRERLKKVRDERKENLTEVGDAAKRQ